MFSPAVRSSAKIKLAITGPSGSGKTKGALLIALGLGAKKIAVIDSENGSASLYSKEFAFDTALIGPPYTTEKYIAAINNAIESGYDCLIVDSISHAWAGEGGILEQKGQMDERGGNSYTNWNKFTTKQQAFLARILNSPIDMICTMRSKQDYVLSENSKGKLAPTKVGMAPVQREGAEYEFTTVLDVAMNHEARPSKDRTGIFDDQSFRITKKTGELIREWLNGADVKVAPPKEIEQPVVDEMEELRGEVALLANQVRDSAQAAKALEFTLKSKTKKGLSDMKARLKQIIAEQEV